MKKNDSFGAMLINNKYSFAFIKKGIVTLCSIVFVSLLSRYLGPELKGEYSAYMSWSSILVIILQMGVIKLYPNYKRTHSSKEIKDIFFSISLFKFIVFCVISFFLVNLFKESKINNIFPLTVLLNMLQGECLFLVLVDNIKYQNIISIIVYLLNAIDILIVYIFAIPSVTVVFFLLMLRDIIAILLSIILMKYKVKFSKQTLRVLKDIIGISFFPVLAALLIEINYRVDVIFLNRMVSNYYVGLYASGVTIAEMAWMIPDVFKEVLFNKTASSDSINDVCFSLRISIMTVIIGLFCLLAIGKLAIWAFYGKEYIESYTVTLLIFFGVPFMAIFKVLNPLIQARGAWKIYIITLLSAALVNIILNYFMINIWGMYGAALSSVISYSISGISLLVYFKNIFKISLKDCIVITSHDIKRIIGFIKR